MLPNYHIIQITHLGQTNTAPARVKLKSELFKQSVTIPFTNEPASIAPATETAVTYLIKKGHIIIGKGEGKDYNYLISDTFEPIK